MFGEVYCKHLTCSSLFIEKQVDKSSPCSLWILPCENMMLGVAANQQTRKGDVKHRQPHSWRRDIWDADGIMNHLHNPTFCFSHCPSCLLFFTASSIQIHFPGSTGDLLFSVELEGLSGACLSWVFTSFPTRPTASFLDQQHETHESPWVPWHISASALLFLWPNVILKDVPPTKHCPSVCFPGKLLLALHASLQSCPLFQKAFPHHDLN